jgi:hypothetical protein
MSLISAYFSCAGSQSSSSSLSIRRVSPQSEDESQEDGRARPSLEERPSTPGPPVSLEYVKASSDHPITWQSKDDHDQVYTHRHQTSSMPLPHNPAIEAPLTSCSYQTLRMEYDMDTWRMYERIQSARARCNENTLQKSAECIHNGGTGNIVCKFSSAVDPSYDQYEPDDSEAIFELDL